MIKIYDNVNRNKLHSELQNAEIETEYVLAIDDTEIGCKIMFANDVDMGLVQQIITAHGPTPLPEPLSEIDKLKVSQAEQFETILEILGGMM